MVPRKSDPIEPKLVRIPADIYSIGIADEEIQHLSRTSPAASRWREKGYFDREQPASLVRLATYQIGKHPVTVAEFGRFLSEAGYSCQEYWTSAGLYWLKETGRTQPVHWEEPKWTADPHLPVVGVSWYEALAYSRWLAARTGRPYRLPSEIEWEAAARGPDGRLYPWGNTFDAGRCNCRDSGIGQTVVPGNYSPAGDSPFRVAEMVGNVSEWTMSLFRPYPARLGDERDDPDKAGERVIRGGSWFSPAVRARTTSRGMNDPDFCDHDVGFRMAAGP